MSAAAAALELRASTIGGSASPPPSSPPPPTSASTSSSLTPDEGPLRLVVEGDLRPARAVRMVESLSPVDLAAR